MPLSPGLNAGSAAAASDHAIRHERCRAAADRACAIGSLSPRSIRRETTTSAPRERARSRTWPGKPRDFGAMRVPPSHRRRREDLCQCAGKVYGRSERVRRVSRVPKEKVSAVGSVWVRTWANEDSPHVCASSSRRCRSGGGPVASFPELRPAGVAALACHAPSAKGYGERSRRCRR